MKKVVVVCGICERVLGEKKLTPSEQVYGLDNMQPNRTFKQEGGCIICRNKQ